MNKYLTRVLLAGFVFGWVFVATIDMMGGK